MSDTPYDPAKEGAGVNLSGLMSYGDYLQIDRILTAQKPLSQAHDELLFIIQHQTSELWMKLAIHEMRATCRRIADDDLQPAFKMLSRVARIFEQLNSAWDVLRSMTPSEYTSFREELGMSSGFQSYQYRMIEFLAGNKNEAQLRPHEHVPDSRRARPGAAVPQRLRRSAAAAGAPGIRAERGGDEKRPVHAPRSRRQRAGGLARGLSRADAILGAI
jgi:tryptophan 2,3-dioxygenase